jgi:hypothetical protein
MRSLHRAVRVNIPALLLLAVMVAAVVFASGCTQPATQSAEQKQFAEVAATQPDSTHIIITYQGGPNMEKIMELETMITDSTGKSQTKSVGSRLATTPITIKGTNTLEGYFSGQDHVVVTGYLNDGSRKVLLDTTI